MKKRPTDADEVSSKKARTMLAARGDVVTQSALSRYVTKYADELRPRWKGKERVISFERLWQHRRDNIRLPAADSDGAALSPDAATRSDAAIKHAASTTANIRAQRMLREHEYKQKAATLMPKSEADEAASEMVRFIRDACETAADETAAEISELTGVAAALIRPHLAAYGRRGADAAERVFIDHGFVPERPVANA